MAPLTFGVMHPDRRIVRNACRAFLIACVVGFAASVSAAPADAPDARMQELKSKMAKERAEAERLKAEEAKLAQETRDLKREMIDAARTVRGFEREIIDIESQLSGLAVAQTEIERRLASGRRQTVEAMMALERIARFPPEAMIAMPNRPADTVRGAILLRAAVPAIEARAARLQKDLRDLDATRTEMTAQRRRLATAIEGMKADRVRLDTMFERKAALHKQAHGETREAEKRLKAMAAEAQSLQDLMRRLEAERKRREAAAKAAREEAEREAKAQAEREARAEAERKAAGRAAPAPKPKQPSRPKGESRLAAKPPAGRPITASRGRLPFPVVGRVAVHYGQTLPTGLTAKGITIESGSGAPVIAPHEGTVVFAGPFRGYGQLLIIEHGEGYHTLLAGMARIDSEPGAFVQAGEPVGRMGNPAAGRPSLYVELRRDGHPINPLPWLAASKEKVSG